MDNMTAALNTWRDLLKALPDLREDQVLELLELEKARERRHSVLKRLHERYSSLRARRERAELFDEPTATPSLL